MMMILLMILLVNACIQSECENDGKFVVENVYSVSYVHAS